ncbi:MAG TPA: hypothetical protein VFN80_12755 [Acidothermaceae bacterium]|nr:hypothetical protein [Acidothermaceae bacterium]
MGTASSGNNPAVRALAIAQALEALFAARHDDATARFDAELTAAIAEGRIDDETARTLRWWQRESVRGARSYLADLLPGVLHADDAAQRRSRAQVDLAAASWQEATDVVRAAKPSAADAASAADADADAAAGPAADPADGADSRLRVRLVAVPRHAARPDDASPTASSNGKDTSGDDNSATTA